MRGRVLHIVFGTMCVAIFGCAKPIRNPELTIESRQLDLGTIPSEGQTVQIPIRNDWTEKLTVAGVAMSCNCVTVHSPGEVVPGDSKQITVVIPPSVGNHSVRLYIKTSPGVGSGEVLLTWHGDGPPTLDPPRLVFRDVPTGATVSGVVRITYAGGDSRYEPKVQRIDTSVPNLAVKRGDSIPALRASSVPPENRREIIGAIELNVSYVAPRTPGKHLENCTFVTSSGGAESALVLPVEVHVVGSLVSQGSVVFSAASPKELLGMRRTVKIFSTSERGQSPNVYAPAFVKSSMARTADRPNTPTTYELTMEVVELPDQQVLRSEIRVGENDSEIRIPLFIFTPESAMRQKN